MVGEMVKKKGRARFYISCNYSGTLYLLVSILLVKLKDLRTSLLNSFDLPSFSSKSKKRCILRLFFC